MRARGAALSGLVLVGLAAAAGAAPAGKGPAGKAKAKAVDAAPRSEIGKPAVVDVLPIRDQLLVYRDDLGSYYVAPRDYTLADGSDGSTFVFFGDSKSVSRQRVIGGGGSSGRLSWSVWSPRALPSGMADFTTNEDGTVSLTCSPREVRTLTPLPADQALAWIAHARFTDVAHQRLSQLLARDDDGIYYFVDRYRDELGGKGFRVFVGPKGALKEMPMTNVVSDSAGEIYATKRGELKIVSGNGSSTTHWHKGGKRVELTRLEPGDNRHLIYREFGIYGPMGVFCDDQ
jgi:hypothetical protein